MNYTTSEFYCTQCGKKGIPIIRKDSRNRESGHLKKLYCLTCGQETNHVECKIFSRYTHNEFLIEFNNHNFTSEGNRIEPNWKLFIKRQEEK